MPSDVERPTQGFAYSLRAFRHREFSLFWTGAVISNIGSWLSNLTVPFVIYQDTHSAFWVGLVSVFQFAPNILLGPWGGVLADRHDRRRVLLVTQTGLALAALLLWGAWVAGVRAPLVIMTMVGVAGMFQGVNLPSWQAFVNDLVPREDLTSAVALNSLQFNAARALGPAIAGILLALAGPGWALLLNAVSFGAVLLALLAMRNPGLSQRLVDPLPVRRQFVNALHYIRSQPGIQVSIASALLVGLLVNPIFQFTVVFSESVFKVGPVALGMLNAALGLGALLAVPLMSGWSHIISLPRLAKAGLFGQGLGLIAFAAAANPRWAAAALVLVGGAFLMTISAGNTAVHLIVANRMRGRVIAIRVMIYTGSFPIAGVVQGALADRFGPRATVAGAGAMLLVAASVFSALRGRYSLSHMTDAHDEDAALS